MNEVISRNCALDMDAGMGITREEGRYCDYLKLHYTGKIVLAMNECEKEEMVYERQLIRSKNPNDAYSK